MVSDIWKVFLIITITLSTAEGLEPGDRVPDFVMPSSNGAPQRLSELIGRPVMLIWLDECDHCEESLIDWQYLAESWAVEGLETWVVLRKNKQYSAPWSRLPVLEYNEANRQAWWFEPSPSVMLISPSGELDYLFINKIDKRKIEIANKLKFWLENKKWFQ